MLKQDEVNYRPAETTAKCGNCKFFANSLCMYVEPPIDTESVCDIHALGAMPEMTGMEAMLSEDPEDII